MKAAAIVAKAAKNRQMMLELAAQITLQSVCLIVKR